MAQIKKTKSYQNKAKEKIRISTAQLSEEIAKAEGILSEIGDGISILDRTFKILYENQVHRDMMGDNIGKYCYRAYRKREGICSGCPIANTFKDGKIHKVQRELKTDEKTRYLDITASPLRDSEGKIIAGIEVVRDITERKLLEEDIKESKEKYQSLYQEFRGILDAIPDALVLLSRDLKVIWSNEVAAKNMNMSLDDFIGQHCYKVRHGRSEPCGKCPVLDCFTSPKPNIVESSTPDGRNWELHVYPVFDDKGEVKGVIEAAHNITNRKRAEEALKASEEKYRDLIENINDVIYSVDNKGIITYISPTVFGLIGYIPSEIVGRHFTDFIFKEDLIRIEKQFKKILSGQIEPSEYRLITKSGDIRWIRTSSHPRYKDNLVIGLRGVLSDITDRKQAEKLLKKSEAELKERVRELEDFYDMAVGRELRMQQLKEENKKLKEELEKYKNQ